MSQTPGVLSGLSGGAPPGFRPALEQGLRPKAPLSATPSLFSDSEEGISQPRETRRPLGTASSAKPGAKLRFLTTLSLAHPGQHRLVISSELKFWSVWGQIVPTQVALAGFSGQ